MKKIFMLLWATALISSSFIAHSMDNQPTQEEYEEFKRQQRMLKELDEKIACLEQQNSSKEVNSCITRYEHLEGFIQKVSNEILQQSEQEQLSILALLDNEKNKYTAFSNNILNSSRQTIKEISPLQGTEEEAFNKAPDNLKIIIDNISNTLEKEIENIKNLTDNK